MSVCKDARGSEGMDKRSAVNPAGTLANLFCGERGINKGIEVVLHATVDGASIVGRLRPTTKSPFDKGGFRGNVRIDGIFNPSLFAPSN